MKKITVILLGILIAGSVYAQSGSPKQLQANARTLMQQGDFDNAVKALESARQQDPNSLELLRDLAYANFLKRDFARSIEIGKMMIDRPDADEQSYQVLGMAYKGIASYKEAGKLYRAALKKFPNSGVIYNEYAEMSAMDKDMDQAISLWEKGIEMDASYSSNYYNAAMYYARNQNWIRAILYGEVFLNLESYTGRTAEVKPVLYNAYKNLLAPGMLSALQNAKSSTVFEKDVLASFAKAAASTKEITSVESLTALRTQFLQDWAQEKQKKYPFRLFEHQQSLLKDGLFEAYNYWLFSPAVNADNLKNWENSHPKEAAGFKKFQDSRVFRVPAGQYYFAS
ncbi:MAG: tetratricopeptide repeat protein [Chitinophagaceae bacterium]|nr:tetratricopeptide repeat protein [Chitinophagaceae bacterium]